MAGMRLASGTCSARCLTVPASLHDGDAVFQQKIVGICQWYTHAIMHSHFRHGVHTQLRTQCTHHHAFTFSAGHAHAPSCIFTRTDMHEPYNCRIVKASPLPHLSTHTHIYVQRFIRLNSCPSSCVVVHPLVNVSHLLVDRFCLLNMFHLPRERLSRLKHVYICI